MGGVCSFGADSLNNGEIYTEDGRIVVHKKQVILFNIE